MLLGCRQHQVRGGGVGVSLIPRVALEDSTEQAVVELGPYRPVRHVAAVTTRRGMASPPLSMLVALLAAGAGQ